MTRPKSRDIPSVSFNPMKYLPTDPDETGLLCPHVASSALALKNRWNGKKNEKLSWRQSCEDTWGNVFRKEDREETKIIISMLLVDKPHCSFAKPDFKTRICLTGRGGNQVTYNKNHVSQDWDCSTFGRSFIFAKGGLNYAVSWLYPVWPLDGGVYSQISADNSELDYRWVTTAESYCWVML